MTVPSDHLTGSQERRPTTNGAVHAGRNASPNTVRTPTDAAYLRDLFNTSSRYYERVNMLTSMGQVVRWRNETIRAAHLRPNDQVLDAFCGPGSLAELALSHLDSRGRLVLVDLSPMMLRQAKARIESRAVQRRGHRPSVEYEAGDLLKDDLALEGFDVILAGWGLRYVEDVQAALIRMRTFLRDHGRIVLLEFTRPRPVSWATPAHFYFRHILPRVGSWLAQDSELHDYLRTSSAAFLSGEELERTLERAGFATFFRTSYLGGLVTILTAAAIPPRKERNACTPQVVTA